MAQWLEGEGVDLIEISGGTYEQPKLLGLEGMEPAEQQNVAASTLAREAYFVDFAKAMKATVKVPLMITGGFRSRAAMAEALRRGAGEVIGLARALCAQPDGAAHLLAGVERLSEPEKTLALIPGWLGFLRMLKALRDRQFRVAVLVLLPDLCPGPQRRNRARQVSLCLAARG